MRELEALGAVLAARLSLRERLANLNAFFARCWASRLGYASSNLRWRSSESFCQGAFSLGDMARHCFPASSLRVVAPRESYLTPRLRKFVERLERKIINAFAGLSGSSLLDEESTDGAAEVSETAGEPAYATGEDIWHNSGKSELTRVFKRVSICTCISYSSVDRD